MSRAIDADALIDDLKHDVAVDQDSLDYEELTDSNRENIQFDKDCKQNAIDLLQHAPTIEPRCEACEAFNKTRLLIPQPQQQKGKLMRRRTFEEMITYFNQTVSDMDIDRKYKITLLGIVTALLQKHDEDVAQIEPQRKMGKWIYGESEAGNDGYYCSKCGNFVPWKYDEYDIDFIKEFLFCNKCGADMTEGEG